MDPLFLTHPELAQAIDRLCERPPWQMTGASALVIWEGALVLELAKPKDWQRRADGAVVVGVGAIGGSLEPGETLLACVQRESQEELGAPLEILSAEETVIVYERTRVARQARLARPTGERPHPYPVLMTVSENLYRPELGPAARTLAIATFWAQLGQEPRLGDLYGLLTLPLENVGAALGALPLAPAAWAEASGARMLTRTPLPPGTLLAPVWTVHSLWRALQVGPLPRSVAL